MGLDQNRVTGGSRLPFKIRPGAPTGSLDILASGDVSFGSNLGLGTGITAHSAAIHIKKTNDPQIRFDENNVAANTWNLGITDVYSNMFTVLNSANPLIGYALKSTGDIYMNNGATPVRGKFAWHLLANGNVEQTGNLWVGGDITAQGTVSGSSSRALKNNINIINGDAILRLISKLDVYSWSYIKDSGKLTHIGPMAEEFFETFNVGIDNKHISPTDTSGISLAAIKALMDKLEVQDAKIAELETKLTELQQH
ncbi:MAG: tail fiber domain-containing protein [Gammaproteobacteria bacterium]|nr:tail fiber domain-containing protein [Gammaproteobacteria bacterium]MBU1479117.1 tail fiber domain-containing protein [Gammaproteobacteria bacterium]MBU2003069.1 tail fiber domain-containing protein [Gammaproteobacteria bacterium]MBU2134265.1 tail fiber domain-containing protein [Gammaproteobacteria bacterium]MBU2187187.1 tail fiber domain-containing protein [Gammaproteobacteria bacterium]